MAKITKEQVAIWKKKHGEDNVFHYVAGDKEGYLRRPDRKIIGAAGAMARDLLNQKEILINNCWLGGDEELLKEDKYFIGLAGVIESIIEVVEGSLKKA